MYRPNIILESTINLQYVRRNKSKTTKFGRLLKPTFHLYRCVVDLVYVSVVAVM